MPRWHGVMKGMTVLALTALAAGTAQLPASVAARSRAGSGSPRPAASAGSSSWRARAALKLGGKTMSVAVDPRANAAYELVARARGGAGPFRLHRIGLAARSGTAGPAFPVSSLKLASGYLWVSGAINHGTSSFRLVLYQVSSATLRVVRSWRLTGERSAGLGNVPVASGSPGTVWVGFERTLWQLNTRTGAVLDRERLRSGLSVTDVAVDPSRNHLYVSAAPRLGGAVMREYSARSGRLLARASGAPLEFSISGASLTAVPFGVWASYRTGMAGQTILLRQRGLRTVHLTGGQGLFDWFMTGSTRFGGHLVWLSANSGAIGCVTPAAGQVRSRATLKLMTGGGELLAVSQPRHEVFALGRSAILAITAPARCWHQ